MGQAKNRLKAAMRGTGDDAKAAQALLIEQVKKRSKVPVKSVAPDSLMQSLTGEESWEQIQAMDGFRHYVLCEQEHGHYLGMIKETRDSRQLTWTDRPLQANAFPTVEAANTIVRCINDDPDYRQVPFVIGALVETETQYVVVLKRDTVESVS